ncbi:uncharacterized protein [Arachis hypogaea]|uniref:uncharacterized protein n=1 Tax=Arachis hypogaea TaxID=3818 RepID=UPI003B212C26
MVSTRAAMESRLEAVEKRIEELQEAQQRSLEAFSANLLRQMRELLPQQHQGGGAGTNNTGGGNDGGRNEQDDERVEGNGAGDEAQRRFEPIRKLDLPVFSGEDPNGWLVRMERYFRVIGVVLAQRLDFATMALEGEALTWFEWWEEYTPFQTWRRFKEDLLKRFQPGAALNPMAPLLEVKQVEDVAQYRREFEAAARTQRNLGIEALMCIFVNGLKKEIQAELEVAQFDNLPALMDRAMAIEWRNQAWKETGVDPNGKRVEGLPEGNGSGGSGSVGARFGFFKNSSSAKYNTHDGSSESRGEIGSNTNRGTPTPRTGLTTSLNGGNNTSHSQTTRGTRRLSNEDWAERQRKGLCFRCGEKWGPDHRCSMKHYQIILLGEDAEEEAAGDVGMNQEAHAGEEEAAGDVGMNQEAHAGEPEREELQLSSYSCNSRSLSFRPP